MKDLLRDIPHQPGCYFFKDETGAIIYIGKAKDIQKRVSQYYNKNQHDPKTVQLVSNIAHIEHIVTDTEQEALILESVLIRKHKPKYNIDLRDNTRYAYIEITSEKVPRLRSVRKQSKNCFGPFTDGMARRNIIRTLNQVFTLRSCQRLPKKVCFYYHIGKCCGPCEGKVSVEEYNKKVQQARMVLEGKTDQLIESLTQQMNNAARLQEFELAKIRRDQIQSLQALDHQQKIERTTHFDQDIIGVMHSAGHIAISVLTMRKGVLLGKRDYRFDAVLGDAQEQLIQFIVQYYQTNDLPREIITQGIHKDQIDLLCQVLEKKLKQSVSITTPHRGIKRQLLDMANKNAYHASFGSDETLIRLQKILRLPETPVIMECFDISNLQGTHIVASMVQFRDGKPFPSAYRRYKIRTIVGQDDFGAMREVVSRRYRITDPQVQPPHLVIIDGGKGQLHAALQAVKDQGLRLPIISLAKKQEEIFVPGRQKSIQLDKKSPELRLLQHIRDEAHRFALQYHRTLREKITNNQKT